MHYIIKNRLINAVQALLAKAGMQVVKTSRNRADATLLAALLAEAAAPEREKIRTKLNPKGPAATGPAATGLIFSFNRPLQLELLLRSYFTLVQNPAPLVVQYGFKTPDFGVAYAQVAALYPQVTWVAEDKFRATLATTLAAIHTPKIFFLVDDIVFTRPLNMAAFAALDTAKYIPSLRLAPTLNRSYTAQMAQTPPAFTPVPADIQGDMLAFNWNERGNEWAYPMSVDGHLFDTAEIKVMSRVTPYKAPNTYEGALMRFAPALTQPIAPRQGLCFAQPKLLNNPCNKVQTEVANVAGNITPESLLARWQAGERLAHAPYLNYPNTAPHTEVPLVFEARGKN